MTFPKAIALWRPRTPFFYGWLVLGMTALGAFAATGVAQVVLGGVQTFIFEKHGMGPQHHPLWGYRRDLVGGTADTLRRQAGRPARPPRPDAGGRPHSRCMLLRALPHRRRLALLCGVHRRQGHSEPEPHRGRASHGGRQLLPEEAQPGAGADVNGPARWAAPSTFRLYPSSPRPLAGGSPVGSWASSPWSLAVPLFLIMRGTPEEVGLLPDGDTKPRSGHVPRAPSAVPQTGGPAVVPELDWRAGEAALTHAFSLVVIAEALIISAAGAIGFQIVPYLMDAGLSQVAAAGALSLSSLLGALGNPGWGYLSDRFSPRRMALVAVGLTALTTSLLLATDSGLVGFFVIVLWGMASGGLSILGSMILAQYFWEGILWLHNGPGRAVSDRSPGSGAEPGCGAIPRHPGLYGAVPVWPNRPIQSRRCSSTRPERQDCHPERRSRACPPGADGQSQIVTRRGPWSRRATLS